MLDAIGIISFLAVAVFIILAIISFFKKTKKVKKLLIGAGACFLIMVIAAVNAPKKDQPLSTSTTQNAMQSAQNTTATTVNNNQTVATTDTTATTPNQSTQNEVAKPSAVKSSSEERAIIQEAKSIPETKFGAPIEDFKKKFGSPSSKYMHSISYTTDDLLIDSDGKNVSLISMKFFGNTYLTKNEALNKIIPFLPEDAKQVKSKTEGNTIVTLYQSKTVAVNFADWYKAWEKKGTNGLGPGLILLRVIEGDPKSTVRNGGVTNVRLELSNLSINDKKDLGLE